MKIKVAAGIISIILLSVGLYYAVVYIKTTRLGGMTGVDYVPADTLFFFGNTEPVAWDKFPWKQWDSEKANSDLVSAVKNRSSQYPDGVRFLVGLQEETLIGERALKKWGIADPFDIAIYFAGSLPVMRIKLKDEQVFNEQIMEVEKRSEIKSQNGKVEGLAYRRYLLNEDGEHSVFLAVAAYEDYGIFVLDYGDLTSSQELALAMGLRKPAQPLKENGRLAEIIKKNAFKSFFGFLDLQAVAQIFTHADNPIAKLLSRASQGKSDQELAVARTSECQKEIEEMVGFWPQWVFGITAIENKKDSVDVNALFKWESKDSETLASLQKLRGFIPSIGEGNQGLLSLKIGLNIGELSSVAMNLWGRLSQAKFTCPVLQNLQNELQSSSPMALLAVAGMVQGIHGVSVDLQELKVKKMNLRADPVIEKLSFVAAISSKNPQKVWNLVSGMMHLPVEMPKKGEPVELPIPPLLRFPKPVKLGFFGSHIAIFTGEKGEQLASSLENELIQANGVFEFGANYRLLFELLNSILVDDAARQQAKYVSASMKNAKVLYKMDFASDGIIANFSATYPKNEDKTK
jgi:hypothetical protein